MNVHLSILHIKLIVNLLWGKKPTELKFLMGIISFSDLGALALQEMTFTSRVSFFSKESDRSPACEPGTGHLFSTEKVILLVKDILAG